MQFDLGAAATAGAGSIIGSTGGALLGMLFQGNQDKRQIRMNQQLAGIQRQNQMLLMDYQNAKQLEMWEKTNYKAQVEQLKKAGLNPAMLYGMGGAGGSIVGGGMPSGSGVTGVTDMVTPMATMGLSLGKNIAETELMKAQADKLKAEAENLRGVERQLKYKNISDLISQINNRDAQTELIKVQTNIASIEEDIKQNTQKDVESQIGLTMLLTNEYFKEMVRKNKIGEETYQETIETVRMNLSILRVQKSLIEQQIKEGKSREALNYDIIKKNAEEIATWWAGINQKDKELLIRKFEANIKADDAQSNRMDATTNRLFLELEQKLRDVPDSIKLTVDGIKDVIQSLIFTRGLGAGKLFSKPKKIGFNR